MQPVRPNGNGRMSAHDKIYEALSDIAQDSAPRETPYDQLYLAKK